MTSLEAPEPLVDLHAKSHVQLCNADQPTRRPTCARDSFENFCLNLLLVQRALSIAVVT